MTELNKRVQLPTNRLDYTNVAVDGRVVVKYKFEAHKVESGEIMTRQKHSHTNEQSTITRT